MRKNDFLDSLYNKLAILDTNERTDIILEYSSHIDDIIGSGKSEDEAVKSFGNIDVLVSELLSAYDISNTSASYSTKSNSNHEAGAITRTKEYSFATSDFLDSAFNWPIYTHKILSKFISGVVENHIRDDYNSDILGKTAATSIISALSLIIGFAVIVPISFWIAAPVGVIITLALITYFTILSIGFINHLVNDFRYFYLDKYVSRDIVDESHINKYKNNPNVITYYKIDTHYAVYIREKLEVEREIERLEKMGSSSISDSAEYAKCQKTLQKQLKILSSQALKHAELSTNVKITKETKEYIKRPVEPIMERSGVEKVSEVKSNEKRKNKEVTVSKKETRNTYTSVMKKVLSPVDFVLSLALFTSLLGFTAIWLAGDVMYPLMIASTYLVIIFTYTILKTTLKLIRLERIRTIRTLFIVALVFAIITTYYVSFADLRISSHIEYFGIYGIEFLVSLETLLYSAGFDIDFTEAINEIYEWSGIWSSVIG